MLRSIFTVGGLILVSRFLGFLRDKLITSSLGVGPLLDVWAAAFMLPNMFRQIFGEGAFNSAFVPLYCRKIAEQGESEADRFASRTITLLFWFLVGSFLVIFIFMPYVIMFSNWGFRGDDRLDLAVFAGRITIGYMILVCLMAAFNGVLNSRKKFGLPAFAYVVFNIILIAVLIVASSFFDDLLIPLCWGVLVAGVFQLSVVIIGLFKYRTEVRLVFPVIDDDIKKLGILMIPGLVSAGVQQLNLLVIGVVASLQIGGKSLIYISDRVNQLPMGLFGVAVGVVLLPEISRALRTGQVGEAKRCLSIGTEMAILFTTPAMIALFVIPDQIIHAIFEGGAAKSFDIAPAGSVLAAFSVGIPAYVLSKVYQQCFYAREDTRTPMRFAIIAAVVNIILCFPLFCCLGVVGCALAASIAGWCNLSLLWIRLRKDGFVSISLSKFSRYFRMFLSALVMGIALFFLAKIGEPWIMRDGDFLMRIMVLALLVGLGVGVYTVFVIFTRLFTVREINALFARKGEVFRG